MLYFSDVVTLIVICRYCALEYERCNDMASAALAYKCMEVAYMRVVYCNDLSANRDRQELQMAVRAAPQGNNGLVDCKFFGVNNLCAAAT